MGLAAYLRRFRLVVLLHCPSHRAILMIIMSMHVVRKCASSLYSLPTSLLKKPERRSHPFGNMHSITGGGPPRHISRRAKTV